MGKRGIVIAIDGPAGSGKSTTARCVANTLAYLYLDTGAMYRALGWALIRKGVRPDDAAAATETAATLEFEFRLEDGCQRVLINGEDVTGRIRTPEVADAASRVAVHPAVRKILVARQQEMGADGGIVLEGRDTGTAVFPGADLKVFLVADVAERARRQQRALLDRGDRTHLDVLMAQIRERDARDRATQRRTGSWPASDAIRVDTTGLSIDAQVARVVALAYESGI
jgi:cytidylate kinase